MAKDIQARIAALKEKAEKDAKKLNALQQKAKVEERKRDTRRKIIVGGLVLAYMEKDPAFADKVRGLLAENIVRPHDREALGALLPSAQVAAPPVSPEFSKAAETVPANG